MATYGPAAASGVTFIRGARSSAAPPNPGVVFLGCVEEAACINLDCDSRKAGVAFEVDDPGDGDACTSCGTKQSNGGSLYHDFAFAKGHQEQTGDEQRQALLGEPTSGSTGRGKEGSCTTATRADW